MPCTIYLGLDPYHTDPATQLTTAGEELDYLYRYLDHDVSDLPEACITLFCRVSPGSPHKSE